MPRSIKCEDCGTRRENVRYANTRYCKSCRLLRDLLYVETEQRPCDACKQRFAPVSRKDTLCGRCNYGSIYAGHCFLCKQDEAELHRDGIPVCVKCIRDPANRGRIIGGLRKGQRDRKAAVS